MAKEVVGLHSTTNPGINSMDLDREKQFAISGGKDGSLVLYNVRENVISGQIELGKTIIGVVFLGGHENVRFVAITEHTAHVYDFSNTDKSFTSIYSYNSVN